jgi:hypothetical protein
MEIYNGEIVYLFCFLINNEIFYEKNIFNFIGKFNQIEYLKDREELWKNKEL